MEDGITPTVEPGTTAAVKDHDDFKLSFYPGSTVPAEKDEFAEINEYIAQLGEKHAVIDCFTSNIMNDIDNKKEV